MDDTENLSGAEEELINPNNIFADDEANDNEQENNDNTETADGPNATMLPQPAPKKRRTINRHPNLNDRYLVDRGEQSIYKVNSYFEDIKYSKGYNSEEKNLNKILRRFEYFGQHCYPKLCFQDFVEKVEKLSKKQSIKHALLSIRRGNNEDVPNEDTENDNPVNDNPENHTDGFGAFDDIPASPLPQDTTDDIEHNKENIEGSQSANNISSNSQDLNDSSVERPQTVITDEMREIMKKKRLEAIEKRKRKLEEQSSQEQTQSQDN